MITIYTMAFNEETIIPFMIEHYRARFSNCKIIVYDNESTDNTAQIALDNNCEVISYPTNAQVDDQKLTHLKNNCWKNADTDWVLVCDTDELLDISEEQLKQEENNGVTAIKSEGHNMVNLEDNLDLASIKLGIRAEAYDKRYLFNKKFISDINYCAGAHTASPIGDYKLSDKAYLCYHYRLINEKYCIDRHKLTGKRLSQINIQNRWGHQYLLDAETELKRWFIWDNIKTIAFKIR